MPNQIITYWKLHKVSILLVIISLGFYYTFAYYLERTDFIRLISLFGALFFLCYKLIQFEKWNFKFLLFVGILFRLVFLIHEPHLSQDFYRFIWDGELVSNFINPYLFTPNGFLKDGVPSIPLLNETFAGMGDLSARNYSNYPPLNQVIFALSTTFGYNTILGSVVSMRLFIILADIGIFYFGRKLLKNLNLSPHLIFWYFLNPLVILELTGNLHFEGVMLSFFTISLYFLSIQKWKLAAVLMACSISIKLVPLMFLPLFYKHLGLKKSLLFYSIVTTVSVLLFAPFFSSEFISNYTGTIALWFSNFEFNAGIYNAIKFIAIKLEAKPWELIKTYGKITPFIIISLVVLFTFLRKNQKLPVLITSMLWVLTAYFLLAATVHPWYIVFLVLLTIFTEYRYSLAWSLVVVLSYYAYSQDSFVEHLGILSIEYLVVFGFIFFEIFRLKSIKQLFRKN
ncbi:mannosyltransferase [Maribacter sp. HTCC2170]|uniref:mannosyltransferase n=1 Tax=Maribacter sp. (strain HTCC2170 / KCCM 42371) TaxID=313603 RepID=UPI00006AE638|nr:mannosyltransferase [Maribacter sp. HTCC2170]EAR00493.1 hypothetical protein FB2170_08309 [Maribacter sp. HTCC2170]